MYKVVYALASDVRFLDEDYETEYEALESLYDEILNEVYSDLGPGATSTEVDNEVECRLGYYGVVKSDGGSGE